MMCFFRPCLAGKFFILLILCGVGGIAGTHGKELYGRTSPTVQVDLMPVSLPPSSPLRLPMSTVFKGERMFYKLVKKAERENWRALPLGRRTATVGLALRGTRYVNFTLEIDDHIESPSVNFHGLDCWTFYEVSLGFARMLRVKSSGYRPQDLLHMIELERYRQGHCTGGYLSRMHFLEEVFYDNTKRGLAINPTRSLGGVRVRRTIREMTIGWKSYRYLRNNRSLRRKMTRIEDQVSKLPVYYIPKSKVAAIERHIQTGDIIAITCADSSAYTSHVGMALRKGNTARFVHATSSRSKGRKVIVDKRISSYLKESRNHSGIIIYRPLDLPTQR